MKTKTTLLSALILLAAPLLALASPTRAVGAACDSSYSYTSTSDGTSTTTDEACVATADASGVCYGYAAHTRDVNTQNDHYHSTDSSCNTFVPL